MTSAEGRGGGQSDECIVEIGEGEEKYKCRLTKYEERLGYHTPSGWRAFNYCSGAAYGDDLAESTTKIFYRKNCNFFTLREKPLIFLSLPTHDQN
jgi:hypothetical protein